MQVRPISTTALWLLTLTCVATASAAPSTNRTIAQGELTGLIASNGSLAWRGIAFAQPPVGDLRWKAPRAPLPWQGTLAATENSAACVQTTALAAPHKDTDGDGYVGSEDCLYLNVFAPSKLSSAKLPVMYWIFGGGNVGGSNAPPLYDGSVLAEQRQVVVVAINYRLGPLGWFMHPALLDKSSSADDRSGNWGTLDTIRGLEWVRENIAAFGGDMGNVTIFGESAGAANVMSLVISPRAKGLFHRAIVESGGVRSSAPATASNYADESNGHQNSSREIVNKVLTRDGKAKDRSDAKAQQMAMTDTQVRKLLLGLAAPEFMKLYNPNNIRLFPYPNLFADGDVLPAQRPLEAIAAGQFNKVPIILGTNRDERRLYLYRDPKWIKILAADPDAYVRYANYSSLAWKLRGVDDIARAMRQAGHDKVFAYRFDWDEQAKANGIDMALAVGAAHTVEIPFVFGQDVGLTSTVGSTDEPARKALSARMMSYWTQFAYSGDPGKGRDGKEAQWAAWDSAPGANKRVIFDTPRDGGVRMSPDEITLHGLQAQLAAEQGFKDQEIFCDIYAATFRSTAAWNEAQYLKLGRDGCAKYPPSGVGE